MCENSLAVDALSPNQKNTFGEVVSRQPRMLRRELLSRREKVLVSFVYGQYYKGQPQPQRAII